MSPKMREFMGMNKQIGNREKGMGFKTITFHQTLHLCRFILDFGAAKMFDTQSEESHHIPDKRTAKRTSQQQEEFDSEVAIKKHQRIAVSLGHEEVQGRKRWHYSRGFFDHSDRANKDVSEPFQPKLSGVRVKFWINGGVMQHKVFSKMKHKELYKYDVGTLDEINSTLHDVSDVLDFFDVYSEYKVYDQRNENHRQTYRAAPSYKGKAHNDWAMFDLRTPDNPTLDHVACHIKCFIDLRNLPMDSEDFEFEAGMYALVDVGHRNPDPNEQGLCDMVEPWMKLPSKVPGLRDRFHQMQLVNVKRLLCPAIVVADLDNVNPRAQMRLTPRSLWAHMFEDWLKAPHTSDYDDESELE